MQDGVQAHTRLQSVLQMSIQRLQILHLRYNVMSKIAAKMRDRKLTDAFVPRHVLVQLLVVGNTNVEKVFENTCACAGIVLNSIF